MTLLKEFWYKGDMDYNNGARFIIEISDNAKLHTVIIYAEKENLFIEFNYTPFIIF